MNYSLEPCTQVSAHDRTPTDYELERLQCVLPPDGTQ